MESSLKGVHDLLDLVNNFVTWCYIFLYECCCETVFQGPCELNNSAEVECCCWTSGSVSASLRLNKRCYVPGETIFINAEIHNISQTDITNTRVGLKQVRL